MNATDQVNQHNDMRIHAYRGTSDEDLLLFQWYLQLITTKELKDFAPHKAKTASQFLTMCQQPNTLLYTGTQKAIEQACLYIPFLTGAIISLWSAQHVRGTKAQYLFAYQTVKASFKAWSVIIALVQQTTKKSLYEKIGFKELGEIPYLLHGKPVIVMDLTQQNFLDSHFSRLGGKIENLS